MTLTNFLPLNLQDDLAIAVYPQQNQNCYINGKAIATFIRPFGLCLTTPTTYKASSNVSPFTPKRQAIPWRG
jgi:hypothetical protein